ncbi:hypothetical protein [Pleomorphomonas sp. PLEO]|uniref:hypothetical protein n=1 Tax=Pleomorphomonas sp. PLEO TaxID=3239306 RepID=UPI00351DF9ED
MSPLPKDTGADRTADVKRATEPTSPLRSLEMEVRKIHTQHAEGKISASEAAKKLYKLEDDGGSFVRRLLG